MSHLSLTHGIKLLLIYITQATTTDDNISSHPTSSVIWSLPPALVAALRNSTKNMLLAGVFHDHTYPRRAACLLLVYSTYHLSSINGYVQLSCTPAAASPRPLRIACLQARLYVRKKLLLAVRMVIPVLFPFIIMFPSRRSLLLLF